MKNNDPVMEFAFQTIKLDEVPTLIPSTYRSKYEALRRQVIGKIESMSADETFIFAPNDKRVKLTDNLIARICYGINKALVSNQMNWKIAYSKIAKAFVVAPYKRYKVGPRGKYKVNKNALATPLNHIDESGDKSDSPKKIKKLLKLTENKLGITLDYLKSKNTLDKNLVNSKRAFLYVGRNALNIKLAHMGKLLGLSSGSTTTLCQQAMENPGAKEKVALLSQALKNGDR